MSKSALRSSDLRYVALRLTKDLLLRIPGVARLDSRRHGRRTGRMYDLEYVRDILRIHLDQWAGAGGTVQGARFLELGPGNSLGQAFLLCLLGAARVAAVDLRPYADAQSGEGVYADILEHLPGWMRKDGFPGVPPGLDWEPVARRLLPDNGPFPVLDGTLEYKIFRGSGIPLPDGSVDRIYSCSVLEHVGDPAESYREQHRILSRGGLASHIIDLRDHHHPDPFHFLRFSDRMWSLMQSRSAGATNRLRRSDHLNMIREAGLEILSERRRAAEEPPNGSLLAPRFRAHDQDDLRTLTMTVLLRKP